MLILISGIQSAHAEKEPPWNHIWPPVMIFLQRIVTIGLAVFFSEPIVIPSLISLILICTHCLLVVFEIAQLQIYNLPFVIQACNLDHANNNSGGGKGFSEIFGALTAFFLSSSFGSQRWEKLYNAAEFVVFALFLFFCPEL